MYGTERLIVRDSPMTTLVFEPAEPGPHPGMIVAQHLPVAHAGLERDPFTLDVGERLAGAGYVAVIPYLFHWWAPDADIASKRDGWRDDRNLEDLTATFDALSNMANVDATRIGIMGHCWGGRVAWLGACANHRLAAAAVFYGGRIKQGLGPGATPPIDLAADITCPVLGIFGNDDQNPSPQDVDDLERTLSDAGVAHEFHRYDGAGHGFQDFVNPDRYRADQSQDAWTRFFAFMDDLLK